MYDGLEFIYSDWRLPNDVIIEGAESIKKHYSKISNKYGYPIQISEAALNVIGYRFLNNGEIEKAIKVFKYNIELYPESANVYDSYGEALEKAGKKEDAFNNYKVAVEMGTEKNDRNLKIYKENMNRVKSANK
jgi:tetratricopeptide (TPR) repeat protein